MCSVFINLPNAATFHADIRYIDINMDDDNVFGANRRFLATCGLNLLRIRRNVLTFAYACLFIRISYEQMCLSIDMELLLICCENIKLLYFQSVLYDLWLKDQGISTV